MTGRRGVRVAFASYATLLFIATHWPRLEFSIADVRRPDVIIHLGAFGIWAFLAQRAALFGRVASARNITLTALLAVVYAVADEASQAIPALGRTFGGDDLAANLLGVGAGTAAACALAAIEPSDHRHGA